MMPESPQPVDVKQFAAAIGLDNGSLADYSLPTLERALTNLLRDYRALRATADAILQAWDCLDRDADDDAHERMLSHMAIERPQLAASLPRLIADLEP